MADDTFFRLNKQMIAEQTAILIIKKFLHYKKNDIIYKVTTIIVIFGSNIKGVYTYTNVKL